MFNRLALALIVSLIFTASVFAQPFAYVVNNLSNDVSVIDTATNMVVGPPIPVGSLPTAVAITPDGTHLYVANFNSNNVLLIDTLTNMVIDTITVENAPRGVAITPVMEHLIPTLSEWGLVAMVGILGIVGFMVMRRKMVTT